MKNKIIALGLLALLIIGFLVIKNKKTVNLGDKPLISTSFYPLYFFTKEVVGDKFNVINITPSGGEPHDYEPTTADLTNIEKSKLLILIGSGFEPWGQNIGENLKSSNVKTITTSNGLATKQIQEDGKVITDPHIWMDPVIAEAIGDKITKSIIEIDPQNKEYYEANLSNLKNKLAKLDDEFKIGLSSCKKNSIVTSHSAFGYLATRYNLRQVSVSGISPDEEPTPKQIAEVAKFAKVNHVDYIFFETLISPQLANTVATEIGAKTIVFNPLEGLTPEEEKEGKNYLTIQNENLQSLKIALQCN